MMNRPLDGVLSAFAHQTILVLGDVMLDEYVWGRLQRISPEAPVPVVEFAHRTNVPGGAANTAANVAALGGRALLAGVVGADEPAERLREALARTGVDADGLSADDERPTTTRVLAHGRQVLRLDRERVAPLPRGDRSGRHGGGHPGPGPGGRRHAGTGRSPGQPGRGGRRGEGGHGVRRAT